MKSSMSDCGFAAGSSGHPEDESALQLLFVSIILGLFFLVGKCIGLDRKSLLPTRSSTKTSSRLETAGNNAPWSIVPHTPNPVRYRLSGTEQSQGTTVSASAQTFESLRSLHNCVVREKQLDCRIWRPLPCPYSCRDGLKEYDLSVRLRPLLRELPTLNFLPCCVAASGSSSRYGKGNLESQLSLGFPIDKRIVREVVDTFPTITSETTFPSLIGTGFYHAERRPLLEWPCISFDSTLVSTSLPWDFGVLNMPISRQFTFLSSKVSCQRTFKQSLQSVGLQSVRGAFRVTPPATFLSIIHLGLWQGDQRGVFFASGSTLATVESFRWKKPHFFMTGLEGYPTTI
ncbi:hypothetical protein F5Y15DRAFT_2295 [Xylariaceae sp. FL0016]|nr:hypothetical protein F5Y15DRAFT_2295 [Xylariaceae sp. FL0016]